MSAPIVGMARCAGVAMIALLTAGGASAEPLKVVASFSIIADMARNVGGERVAITTLVGPNGDAHVYEPKPADAAAVGGADVVLVNGLHFEGFLNRLVEASGTSAPVVELAKGSALIHAAGEAHGDHGEEPNQHEQGHDHAPAEPMAEGHGDGHHHGAVDPHAWHSVPNAILYVNNIADAFCAADAAGCDNYSANAARYSAELKALDAQIRSAVAAIPEAKRTIITSHDAFGYFEHEYGLHFLAPEGVSTDAEASAADVAALIRQVRGDGASAIFVENITNPRLIEQIAGETGLAVGGELYSDALSDAGGAASTYVDMMRHNLETIAGAISQS